MRSQIAEGGGGLLTVTGTAGPSNACTIPQHQVFTDVASGLNYKRRGLARLLDKVHEGVVKEVVVSHKDRLARFGVELIVAELRRCGASLVILDPENNKPEGQDLVEDLTAMVHVFYSRLNRKRRNTDAHQGGKTTKKCRTQGQEHSGEGDAEASLRSGNHRGEIARIRC